MPDAKSNALGSIRRSVMLFADGFRKQITDSWKTCDKSIEAEINSLVHQHGSWTDVEATDRRHDIYHIQQPPGLEVGPEITAESLCFYRDKDQENAQLGYKQLLRKLDVLLTAKKVHKAPQRTNVFNADFPLESDLLGLYTTRGSGVTAATFEWEHELPLLHELAGYRPRHRRASGYLSIQVSTGSGNGMAPHVDRANLGQTDIIAVGRYHGGRFWLAKAGGEHKAPLCHRIQDQTVQRMSSQALFGDYHNIRHRWMSFQGSTPHA
eukprot:4805546-Amphidinium_carterae.1